MIDFFNNKPCTLAINTLGDCTSVALVTKGVVYEAQSINQKHAMALPKLVDQVLDRSMTKMHNVACMVANIGPGSFTGLRVGLAGCMGYAVSRDLPIWQVTNPAVIAMQAVLNNQQRTRQKMEIVAVADDARMQAAYIGLYEISHEQACCIHQEQLWSLEKVSKWDLATVTLLAGNAWQYSEYKNDARTMEQFGLRHSKARAMLELVARDLAGQQRSWSESHACYLRDSVLTSHKASAAR